MQSMVEGKHWSSMLWLHAVHVCTLNIYEEINNKLTCISLQVCRGPHPPTLLYDNNLPLRLQQIWPDLRDAYTAASTSPATTSATSFEYGSNFLARQDLHRSINIRDGLRCLTLRKSCRLRLSPKARCTHVSARVAASAATRGSES